MVKERDAPDNISSIGFSFDNLPGGPDAESRDPDLRHRRINELVYRILTEEFSAFEAMMLQDGLNRESTARNRENLIGNTVAPQALTVIDVLESPERVLWPTLGPLSLN